MVLMTKRLGVTLIFLPHNSTHRLQPNDQLIHLLEKLGIKNILGCIRQCWANENMFVDQELLAKGKVVLRTCFDGLGGDGTLRDPNFCSAQWRTADFHLGSNRSTSNPSQRDYIIAALYSWKWMVTAECIVDSYRVTGIVPLDMTLHLAYTAREQRAAAGLHHVDEALHTALQARLESASTVNCGLPLPGDAPVGAKSEPAPTSSLRVAARTAARTNDDYAEAFFEALLAHPGVQTARGTDKLRIIANKVQGFLNKVDKTDKRMALVRGTGGRISYAPRTEDTFDEKLAAAARSRAGVGVPRNMINTKSGNSVCGLIFSGKEVKLQAAEVAIASDANIKALTKKADALSKRDKDARQKQRVHSAATAGMQAASDAALAVLAEAQLAGAEEEHSSLQRAAAPAKGAGTASKRPAPSDDPGAKRVSVKVARKESKAASQKHRMHVQKAALLADRVSEARGKLDKSKKELTSARKLQKRRLSKAGKRSAV